MLEKFRQKYPVGSIILFSIAWPLIVIPLFIWLAKGAAIVAALMPAPLIALLAIVYVPPLAAFCYLPIPYRPKALVVGTIWILYSAFSCMVFWFYAVTTMFFFYGPLYL